MKNLSRAAWMTACVTLAIALTTSFANAVNFGVSVQKTPYGTTSTNASIDQYTLTNANGLKVSIITYGAIMTSVSNPSHSMPNVLLGFNNLNDYENKNSPHFGSLIGRYANRIANGTFTLNGTSYCLDANNGANTLHGGFEGFDTKVWNVTKVTQGATSASVQLHYLSAAGEGWTDTAPNPNCPSGAVKGFPGNLNTYVTFTLTNQNQIIINYSATTDASTVVNLTNHNYWNLAGEGSGTIYSNIVSINADKFVPVASNQIPDGTFRSVKGTPFDFRNGKAVVTDIRKKDQQLIYGNGYDLSWVVNQSPISPLTLAATVTEPVSRRTLFVWTDQPGIQFYTGNSLDGTSYGASNRQYRQSDGLALETQHFPNSPNQPNFPSTTLLPGQKYQTTTIYQIADF
jgi:aldose 1-epimerase